MTSPVLIHTLNDENDKPVFIHTLNDDDDEPVGLLIHILQDRTEKHAFTLYGKTNGKPIPTHTPRQQYQTANTQTILTDRQTDRQRNSLTMETRSRNYHM